MKRVLLLAFTTFLFPYIHTHAQDRFNILKSGGFMYFNGDGYNGISLHVEYEFLIAKSLMFSTGPRAEYIAIKNGAPSFTVGYEIKWYPIAKYANRRLHGPFIGIDPLYRTKDAARISYARYGPGVGFVAGYQHQFKNRVAVCAEMSPVYIYDINERTVQSNPTGWYWYGFACVKIGFRL